MTEFADGHVFPPIVDASDYLAQNSPNASKTTGGQPTTAAPTAAAKTGSQPESADNSAVEKLPDGKLKNAKETKPSDSSVKKDGGDTKKPPQDKSEKDDVKKEKPPEIDPRCCQSGCRHCGCRACGPHGKSSLDCCPSDYRCECRCEKEKVEHECFVVKCEAICVPPVRLPWGHGKFLCGGIKCVKKFSTDKYECEETVTKWSAKKIGGSCTD